MTRARPKPPDADPPPVDRERVRLLLGLANDLRESGVNLHCHSVMTELAEASRNVLAIYVFAFICDDAKLDDDRLDAFADGLTGHRLCDCYGYRASVSAPAGPRPDHHEEKGPP